MTTSDSVNAVAFSPDGRLLADGGGGGVRLWDLADPTHPKRLGPMTTSEPVNAVTFIRDGHTLTSGGADGIVQLWDVAAPAHPKPLGELLGHTDMISSLASSQDGHTLVSAGYDSTARVWNIDTKRSIDQICRVTQNSLTRQLWEQHIPGLPFKPACP
ncbi:WD40 repeat domain-containing protein [Streptomyces mirabilis]|uniref:WD40 repeat domain-containing protein n=1 Tax=Streptomyces mirabilis TaxID=68239 RepID=UPI00368F2B28